MKLFFMRASSALASGSAATIISPGSKIIDLMKVVPVTGVYPGPNAKSNQIMERHQKELSAYLARARGPGESSMKLATRARPTREAARAVWTLYDLPHNPDGGHGPR